MQRLVWCELGDGNESRRSPSAERRYKGSVSSTRISLDNVAVLQNFVWTECHVSHTLCTTRTRSMQVKSSQSMLL